MSYVTRRKAELACQGERAKLANMELQAARRIEQEQKAKRKRAAKEQRARKRDKRTLEALNSLIARGSASDRNVSMRDELTRKLADADGEDAVSGEDSESDS